MTKPIGNWPNTESIDVSTKDKKEELIAAINKYVEKIKEAQNDTETA